MRRSGARGVAGKSDETIARLSWKQARWWRMERHHLVQPVSGSGVLDVVERLCGLQAQVLSSAELTLWARTRELDRDTLPRALWQDRTLVKLWAMRGTLHLLAARELGLWLAGLGTYTTYRVLPPDELDKLVEAVATALDGQLRTRAELAADVGRSTGSTALGERILGSWGLYLKPPSLRGQLCFADGDGQRVRFTSPASWLAQSIAEHDPETALAEIVRRFLRAHGPATTADLCRWWGVGQTRGLEMIAAAGDDVVTVDVDGDASWILAADVRRAAAATRPAVARLLPAFDQWTLTASRDVGTRLDPAQRARVYRPQGWISPIVLVDGEIRGVWRHMRKGRRLRVEVEPFTPLARWARVQIDAEAARLAGFLGGELVLDWR